MNQVPQSISVGLIRDMELRGVDYDPALLTCEVKAHYQLHELEHFGQSSRVYGDLYIAGIGQDFESALDNLIAEINRLTGAKS